MYWYTYTDKDVDTEQVCWAGYKAQADIYICWYAAIATLTRNITLNEFKRGE